MKTRSFPLFLILLATGCIKEPGPEVPVPRRPQWLVSKITMLHRAGSENPLPGESPLRLLKETYEFHYNASYKLVSRYRYSAEGDTLNLQLRAKDSLWYDARYRVTQADVTSSLGEAVTERRKFSYPGNDTLPSSMEIWYRRSDTLYRSGTVSYVYRTDTVMQVSQSLHGLMDTMLYVYTGGNFRKMIFQGGYEDEIYTQYDRSPAIERLTNQQHGLSFRMTMDYVSPPVFSSNNWTGQGPQSWEKSIEYNANGLVSRYVIMEPYPEPEYWTFRIEYFAPDP